MTQRKRRPRGAGTTRQLPSGRWQARFLGPDGLYRPAPVTFDTKLDASAWLNVQADDVASGEWAADRPRRKKVQTFREYSEEWLDRRDLTPSTRMHYEGLLRRYIWPALGTVRTDRLSADTVKTWYYTLDPDKWTARAHAYSLLRTICTTAVFEDGLMPMNPCKIYKASKSKARHVPRMLTLDELDRLVETVPARYKMLTNLTAWCALRFGEVTELRRKDVDLEHGALNITRGVTRVVGKFVVGPPKTEAGIRTVFIPPHLIDALAEHLATLPDDPDQLLFPSQSLIDGNRHMQQSSFTIRWNELTEKAGLAGLHFHDLRHWGGTTAAYTGATLKELMDRLGHASPAAALRYQHTVDTRRKAIAARMSEIAAGELDEAAPPKARKRTPKKKPASDRNVIPLRREARGA